LYLSQGTLIVYPKGEENARIISASSGVKSQEIWD
jgi:hypothetical protein